MNTKDVQVLLLEMQPVVVASVRTTTQDMLSKAAAAVVELSGALGLPVLASVVPLGSEPPKLIDALASLSSVTRTTITPFGDGVQRALLEATGRKILAVGGVSSEIAILNTVLTARQAGYEVHVLMDCCGGLDCRTEAAALRQMEMAGAIPSNVSSFFTAMVDDMATAQGVAVMAALAKLWSWEAVGEATPSPREQVAAVFEDVREAWRAGEAAGFAKLFTPQAHFVAFDGAVLDGQDAIAGYHAAPFATYLANTELTLKIQDVRALTDEALLVTSQGGILKNGSSQEDLAGISAQTFVLLRRDSALQIDVFHNTRIRPIDGPQAAEVWRTFDRAWSSHIQAKPATT